MRIAVLSDIHGNREAFAAVLADLAGRDVQRVALLGDLVGYGPDPEWCVDRAMALSAAGAICIRGNHDSAIDTPSESMNPVARAAIDWTRPRLSPEQRGFLSGLPLTAEVDETLFVHASAHSPQDWIYVTSAHSAMPCFRVHPARVFFCGHVHVPALYTRDRHAVVRDHAIPMGMPVPLIRSRRWLAVVGAVGQPRDGVPEAGYAIYDTGADTVTFRRVPYDVARTAARIRAEGLPEQLATRLMEGR